MEMRQREHVRTVMRLAGDGAPPVPERHDEVIHRSWKRCVHEYRLDPARLQPALILPSERLREHQDRMEEFVRIARHGLETLYQQVAGMGYVVLLTDARGVTVDFIGDLNLDVNLRRAGLYLGAEWSEAHAGTCGVGTAIVTGEALTVHQDDHFDATHIPLTCSAAPVFDPLGRLNAVLDISALSSPQPKASQHLALQLVKVYANHVENASFLQCFRRDWILKLNAAPEFVDVNPDYLVAVDAAGRVIGHNRRAQRLLEAELGPGASVIGQSFERLFDARLGELDRFLHSRPPHQRALTLARSGRLLFLAAVPPAAAVPSARRAASGVPERGVPLPLAALSGGDARLDRQIERAARLVNSPVSVLLHGPTGTGKEYFAKALHESSERRRKPFVAVNCAAIPETLIESELFGHLPGSFSGAAAKGKRGLIQEADGGTLFLDEIGDMPRPLQARLLRVLAEREVLPIGASRPVPVDIRVISATHRDLEALVREGGFRDDLYYRLNGARIVLPPLCERSDFAWLVRRMLRECAGEAEPPQLAPGVLALLQAHGWPGNLRELRNVLAYAQAVCRDGHITPDDLPEGFGGFRAAVAATPGGAQDEAHADPQAQLLIQYLRAARWNVTAVARQLGVARMTLYRRMKRWGIASPNHRDDAPGGR